MSLRDNLSREARLAAVLDQHKRDMADVIAIAARHPTDRILQGLGEKAFKTLQAIGRIETSPFLTESGFDDLGEWGVNGKGPALRGMLTDARLHDEMLRQQRRAA